VALWLTDLWWLRMLRFAHGEGSADSGRYCQTRMSIIEPPYKVMASVALYKRGFLCQRRMIVAQLAWPIHAAVEVTFARSIMHRLALRRLLRFPALRRSRRKDAKVARPSASRFNFMLA
jgi:hypothetical protein